MDNIRLHGMPTTSFEKVLLWKVIRYSYQFFIFFYFSRYHFYNFLEFHSALPEKDFPPKFSLFNGFTPFPQPHPLIGPLFSRLSWKCLMKYFFAKIYWQNPAKYFLKVATTDSLVFFSKHSSTTAILTQASVITCK